MKTTHRFNAPVSASGLQLVGGGLTSGQVATLHNGPQPVLLRFRSVDNIGDGPITLENYDVEVGAYRSFTWTADVDSVVLQLAPVDVAIGRRIRATLTEAPP